MKPRKVLIVGGVSEGWITAAHLNAVLNRNGRTVADISVLEVADPEHAAVGEVLLPYSNRLLAILGVDQRDFMRRVDATLSQGTKFANWLDETGHIFYHPFGLEPPGTIDRAAQRWLRSNRSIPFAETISVQPALCEADLAPLMLSRWDFGPPLTYGFQVEEEKFADYLREAATAQGVKRRRAPIATVEIAENGDIAAVQTGDGQRLEADLFIDCTRSAALLNDTLDIEWVDCSEYLLCDRALTMRISYEQYYPGFVHPYSTASAVSAGWIRHVPLLSGRSLSYFHASAFIDEDAAEQELRAFEGPHAERLDSELVQFKTGHRTNAWVRNCVAIGAASSYIEPLESTSLYLVDLAAEMLVDHFPYTEEMTPLAFRFNRIMVNRFYEILDLVNLHYCLSRRDDSDFWRQVQRPERINGRLQAKLTYWRAKRPTAADFEDQCFPAQADNPLPASGIPGDYRSPVDTAALWDYRDYEVILYGMGFLDSECDDWFGRERPDPGVLPQVIQRLRLAPQKLPPHDTWLKQVCGMPDYPVTGGANG